MLIKSWPDFIETSSRFNEQFPESDHSSYGQSVEDNSRTISLTFFKLGTPTVGDPEWSWTLIICFGI